MEHLLKVQVVHLSHKLQPLVLKQLQATSLIKLLNQHLANNLRDSALLLLIHNLLLSSQHKLLHSKDWINQINSDLVPNLKLRWWLKETLSVHLLNLELQFKVPMLDSLGLGRISTPTSSMIPSLWRQEND